MVFRILQKLRPLVRFAWDLALLIIAFVMILFGLTYVMNHSNAGVRATMGPQIAVLQERQDAIRTGLIIAEKQMDDLDHRITVDSFRIQNLEKTRLDFNTKLDDRIWRLNTEVLAIQADEKVLDDELLRFCGNNK